MHLTKIQDPKIQHQMDPETYSRMFIATLLIVVPNWSYKCPSTVKWIKNILVYLNNEIYIAMKMNES